MKPERPSCPVAATIGTLSEDARRPARRRRTAAAFHHIEGKAAGLRMPLSQLSPGRAAQAEVSFSA